MGYRSDVYIKTTKKGYEKLREEIEKRNENGLKLIDNYGKLFYDRTDDTVTIELTYMKWYPEYDDVRSVENSMCDISDTYPLHFIRIGEQLDDVEENYYYPDDFAGDFDCLELYRYVKPIGEETTNDKLFNEIAV